ncbi:acyl-homoserine-lactone synthase [Pacificoceanicola onchidii]|uniref:acyl-homoserine-lactone synthase n=1 Tax=Pacificoceanicola onchidii TaxID=2562685 RepID=UPI0010A66CDF|nr:acyl-homoserine-lactone synthase [Pacificoceanicola onchidii]
MYISIQPHQHTENADLLTAFYRLRKCVFFDQLEWDVPVDGDIERDEYDDIGATYLIWCSDDRQTIYGGLRLLPTSGPTLLHDVFYATHGNNPGLARPDVWEGTRMCVNEAALNRDMPGLAPADAFNTLFVALCEMAVGLGISRLVSNFEASMSRVYRRAGLKFDTHGSAHEYGRRPVYCASFEVSEDILDDLRDRHNLSGELLADAPIPAVSLPPAALAALPSMRV